MSARDDAERIKALTYNRADQLVRGLTLEFDARIRQRTPVDTGRARGNWNVAQDAPDDTVDEFRFDQAAAPRAVPATVKAGGVTYITNSLPYILRLEHGWSRQAPAGMVRVTVSELASLVSQVTRELSRGAG